MLESGVVFFLRGLKSVNFRVCLIRAERDTQVVQIDFSIYKQVERIGFAFDDDGKKLPVCVVIEFDQTVGGFILSLVAKNADGKFTIAAGASFHAVGFDFRLPALFSDEALRDMSSLPLYA